MSTVDAILGKIGEQQGLLSLTGDDVAFVQAVGAKIKGKNSNTVIGGGELSRLLGLCLAGSFAAVFPLLDLLRMAVLSADPSVATPSSARKP